MIRFVIFVAYIAILWLLVDLGRSSVNAGLYIFLFVALLFVGPIVWLLTRTSEYQASIQNNDKVDSLFDNLNMRKD